MRTPLFNEHIQLGAKMTDFAGWEMPAYYSHISDEVLSTRRGAGIFDLSHMGEFLISGQSALDSIQLLTTNDASNLKIGRAQYTLMCLDDGGVIDDLLVYRTGELEYMLVVNASNIQKDYDWITGHLLPGTSVRNRSDETALIAVQGPESASVLRTLLGVQIPALPRNHIIMQRIGTADCSIATTGYTGELGYEIYCPTSEAVQLWNLLMNVGKEFGMIPVGLAARDILRTEAAYPLYGHEIDESITPIDAGLGWAVKLSKGEFIGKDAISEVKEAGPARSLVGLTTPERCILRQGYAISKDGDTVGEVTSGTFSPTLNAAIAMAYVEPDCAASGTMVEVKIRERLCALEVVNLPFYKRPE
jgi:aminomethyltransferase